MLWYICVAMSIILQRKSSKRIGKRRRRSGEILNKSGACGISGDWCDMLCSLSSVWWSNFVFVL